MFRFYLLAGVISVLIITALITYQLGVPSGISGIANTLLFPIQEGIHRVGVALGWAPGVRGLDQQVSVELQALREENAELRAEAAEAAELRAENAYLRELLDLKSSLEHSTVAAEVIARDRGSFMSRLVVNRGSSDGVREGDPVVSPAGVVGRVLTTGQWSSTVMLVTDPQSAVSGIVQRSRGMVIVEGAQNDQSRLRFTVLSPADKAAVGDVIITSGYGGVFPKGIVVGTVEEVGKDFHGIVDEGWLRPSAGIERLESVLIITAVEGRQSRPRDENGEETGGR